MTSIQKAFLPVLSMGLVLAFASCNNSSDKKEEAPKADTTKAAPVAAATPAPAAFQPFDMMEINHAVKDYAVWHPLFKSDSTARKAAGLEDLVVGRVFDKENNLQVVERVSDIQKAKAFAADPRLKEVMAKGGVVSKPTAEFYHVLRFNPDTKEKTWVVVTHKVKNYDAWLKVYDAEGTAARAEQGLIDVLLARSVEDSNTVQIVFDIKDMAKAKASIMSEEKKKLMMSAGVDGAPKIEFYKQGE